MAKMAIENKPRREISLAEIEAQNPTLSTPIPPEKGGPLVQTIDPRFVPPIPTVDLAAPPKKEQIKEESLRDYVDPKPEESVESTATTDVKELSIEDLTAQLNNERAQRRQERKRLQHLERELAVRRGEQTESKDEEIQRLIEEKAEEKRLIDRQADAQRSFDETCNKIADKAKSTYRDFTLVLPDLIDAFGGNPGPLIEALVDIAPGNEHKVMYHLAKDLNEADKIYNLFRTNANKASATLAALNMKINAPPRVSNAPPPLSATGSGAAVRIEPTNVLQIDNEKDWIAQRNEQEKQRRESRWGRR